MAVYQISKIQIRRGKANGGVAFPQLASGEMGWAIDTQELFIGNGSVAEGAPAVSNTKIITEHDNLLSAAKYSFNLSNTAVNTGASSNLPLYRSLQDRLDDEVTVLEFGAIGDGITDDSDAIIRAITQLFANLSFPATANYQYRKTLRIPAGHYLITKTILIPSYANIVGDGIDKTVIKFQGASSVMQAVSSNATITAATQPRYINISNLTITTSVQSNPCIDFTNTCNSDLCNIKLVGSWTTGTYVNHIGIKLFANTSISNIMPAINNTFDRLLISGFYYGVYCNQDVQSNIFNNGSMTTVNTGFFLNNSNATLYKPVYNQIINYNFTTVTTTAVYILAGTSNFISNCTLTNVGTTIPQLYFTEYGNELSNIRSDRSTTYGLPSNSDTYVPEISGHGTFISDVHTVTLPDTSGSLTSLFRLPLHMTYAGTLTGVITYTIDYSYVSSSTALLRKGVMSIIANSGNATVNLEDEYAGSGLVNSSNYLLLEFSATIVNNSIMIKFLNNLGADTGLLSYTYKSTF
jgi:hypothetical protein